MASSSSPPQISILFARGVLARLAIWPALRLAVHQNWGGPQSIEKQRWLAGIIVDEFEASIPTSSISANLISTPPTKPVPDEEYIETLLLQVLDDEFEVALEDGSASVVASDVIRLWAEACNGGGELLQKFEDQADRLRGKAPQYEVGAGSGSDWEDDDSDEDSDGEDEEAVPRLLDHQNGNQPRNEPEVDEDGFTTVTKKGRR
ncbi:Pre-rRNA-processing protein TSR2-domain-containing protein [Hygrophoropsis aurantiaca]|uniref:Pre-rRNA-processing protein TSR2-domain-containing protein n=1 Tax=Hygrophoropsis aurantiaca TaxID=72124 RepID=A0ACB7ZPQ4_9AGAM|nr:Pre-rRNA-processing protein TSR2-domain-containing protein [Hygrophoropsis aurantiaca]